MSCASATSSQQPAMPTTRRFSAHDPSSITQRSRESDEYSFSPGKSSRRNSSNSSMDTSRSKLFQPQAPPRKITGPVFYYREIDRIEKKERSEHLKEIKQREFNKNIRSPYRQDFVQLRASSVMSTKRQLAAEKKGWLRQRAKDNKVARKAIENEYESERRHCHTDILSKTHPIIHILGV